MKENGLVWVLKKFGSLLKWLGFVFAAVGIVSLPLMFEAYNDSGDYFERFKSLKSVGDVVRLADMKWLSDSPLDPTKAGQFGDFVGGYIGTIAFLVSLFLVFRTYRNQKATNEQQTFDTHFFELLKLHRENMAEIEIGGKCGRRAFVSLLREFRMIWELVGIECTKLELSCSTAFKIDLAYMAFYYGVGPNSTRVLLSSIIRKLPGDEVLVRRLARRMQKAQRAYKGVENWKKRKQHQRRRKVLTKGYKLSRLVYCPYDGHQSRLAHYFRHLYRMMKFVDERAPKGKALDYADIVRAQLSNHEQAIFCLNALSQIGDDWADKKTGLIHRYHLIKNIPKDFFDPKTEFDIQAVEFFPKMPFEFKK
jgi:hypothetical protein